MSEGQRPMPGSESDAARDAFEAFAIGQRFLVVPPGAEPRAGDDRIHLTLSRGAFGSGEHETTASCIEVLEELPEVAGARVLDLGSGTGLLSLVAIALGARSATCVDIAPHAVETARRNGELNGMQDRLEHVVGTLADVGDEHFDLVVANLYGDLLLDLAEGLVARTRSGGTILLSGMLWEYNFVVRDRFQRLGCRALQNRMLEEFSTTLMRRGGGGREARSAL